MNEKECEPWIDARDKLLVPLAGQSNMAGRGYAGPDDLIVIPNLLMIRPDGKWQTAIEPITKDRKFIGTFSASGEGGQISGNERHHGSKLEISPEIPDHGPEFFQIVFGLFHRIVFPLMPQHGNDPTAFPRFGGFSDRLIKRKIIRIFAGILIGWLNLGAAAGSEIRFLKQYGGTRFTYFTRGSGRFIMGDPPPEECRRAAETLDALNRALCSGQYDVIAADEILGSLQAKLFTPDDLKTLLDTAEAHPEIELILTGRNAPDFVTERAGLVSEVRCIKHYYTQGRPPKKGIEF